jgi:hypothetical protein
MLGTAAYLGVKVGERVVEGLEQPRPAALEELFGKPKVGLAELERPGCVQNIPLQNVLKTAVFRSLSGA